MSTGTEIGRALDRLCADQLPSGEFPMAYWPIADPAVAIEGDSTPFAAALIAHCLSALEDPRAIAIRDGTLRFIRDRMEPGGVWRYWRADGNRDRIPPDLDDIACCTEVLRRHGHSVPENRAVMLGNRTRDGLFYTWITPRWPPPRVWRVLAGELAHPRQARTFWRGAEAKPTDVDGVVNANVLLCLGRDRDTQPVVDHLLEVTRSGTEVACDRWYQSAPSFHYMLSRCRAHVAALDAARATAVERLSGLARPDGRIGDGPLETALAACSLADWDAAPALVAAAVTYLHATQRPDGRWAREPSFWGGPSRTLAFGSEALTTAHCVEALARCT